MFLNFASNYIFQMEMKSSFQNGTWLNTTDSFALWTVVNTRLCTNKWQERKNKDRKSPTWDYFETQSSIHNTLYPFLHHEEMFPETLSLIMLWEKSCLTGNQSQVLDRTLKGTAEAAPTSLFIYPLDFLLRAGGFGNCLAPQFMLWWEAVVLLSEWGHWTFLFFQTQNVNG